MKPWTLFPGLLAGLAGLGLTWLASLDDPEKAPAVDPTMPRYSRSGYDLSPLSPERLQEILATLTPEQIEVTQKGGTERAGTGHCLDEKREGIYVSVVGGLPLFRSSAKFESGTGWPSFIEPFDPDHVEERADASLGMRRIELVDARSGAHLGHVFDDGPQPTGKRYCINAAALRFVPAGEPLPEESRPVDARTAYFGGGCFWGVEDVFQQIPGVMDAVSGYQGGRTERPTYRQVCAGGTGHAEAVRVTFDPARVDYRELLRVFFLNHDPTTLNRQGPDVGEQYRSVVFAVDEGQRQQAEEAVRELERTRFEGRKIVTQIVHPAPTFWPAEEYHQDYHRKHGGSCRVVR